MTTHRAGVVLVRLLGTVLLLQAAAVVEARPIALHDGPDVVPLERVEAVSVEDVCAVEQVALLDGEPTVADRTVLIAA